MNPPSKPLQSVKKFYFLEYFYVLLKSVEKYPEKGQAFDYFKELKQEHRLGESKYKRLVGEDETLTVNKLNRYRYTFEQVIEEAKEYELIKEDESGLLRLTPAGTTLLLQYESGSDLYNNSLFTLMESRYRAFRYIIDFLYEANEYKPGLLIFPIYSPRQLGFERSKLKTASHIIEYSEALVTRLQQDIQKYLGETRYLSDENQKILSRLNESGLLPASPSMEFVPEKYNVITKRFRDFWITYFLNKIYKYEYSMNSFDIWTYRGKQIGIIQATEFYPSFNGRIVYPTSVVVPTSDSSDFNKLYSYEDGKGLYRHEPSGEHNQNKFVDFLVKAYFDLRQPNMGYFISLNSLRELVCFNLKISESLFEKFLDHAYKLNLSGDLKIRISLEVDRLPEETKAMYLKQEPVMVDGKKRNIIAIDVSKGEKAA
jgi:hypothetical protein